MQIEKHKLPKGYSYPIKSSIFESILNENNISTFVHLIYKYSKIFFDAHYWLPNQNVSNARFYVRIGCIESSKHKDALKFMNTIVMPDFIKWCKKMLSLPEGNLLLTKENYFWREFKNDR
jgi:hypothetical protein